MVKLHCSIVVTIPTTYTLAAKIFDSLLLSLYPPLLAVIIEAGLA
jgi:hypothetical protein